MINFWWTLFWSVCLLLWCPDEWCRLKGTCPKGKCTVYMGVPFLVLLSLRLTLFTFPSHTWSSNIGTTDQYPMLDQTAQSQVYDFPLLSPMFIIHVHSPQLDHQSVLNPAQVSITFWLRSHPTLHWTALKLNPGYTYSMRSKMYITQGCLDLIQYYNIMIS